MSCLVETYQNENGNTVNIFYDDCPESPREWCNLGKFLVPDRCKYAKNESSLRLNWDNYEDDAKTMKAAGAIFLPVFVLDHSGVKFSTGSFGDPWDSGQIGFYVIERDDLKKEFPTWKRLSKKRLDQLKRTMRAEVDVFSDYVDGNVYGYEVTDPAGALLDSCWGYYGFAGLDDLKATAANI